MIIMTCILQLAVLNNDCCFNSNFPVYNDCPIYIGSTDYSFILLTKNLLYFMTVKSIDETHDYHIMTSILPLAVL